MAVPITDVVATVAGTLSLPAADARVFEATAAAWQYVCITEGRIELGEALPEIDADPIITQGLIGFARAVYLDAISARGAVVALADQTVDTVFTPEDLYRHWRHFFVPMRHSWGIA